MKALKVLHITPHAGGGVGSVIRALLKEEIRTSSGYTHSLASLETLNDVTKSCLDSLGMKWSECANTDDIRNMVADADMVLIHWWNHPLLMKLLYEGLPPSRLAIWSHVNGFAVPQSFFDELFDMPDIFVFATESSHESHVVKKLHPDLKSRLRVIRSCCGIPEGADKKTSRSGDFKIGYVGTVEPAKMHPEFLELCAAAAITSKCIVAGGPGHEQLRKRALELGVSEKFDILGPVADPKCIFAKIHAFAYPLNPNHYGSGEQVLIEAMAFGAVPVVLGNLPEKALIRHGKTGLVAANKAEFSEALRFLAGNPAERERLAEGGHKFVMEECGISISQNKFHSIFKELIMMPKRSRKLDLPEFSGVMPGSPFHLFLASCGDGAERKIALAAASGKKITKKEIPPFFLFATRGAPAHYLRMLGYCSKLEAICRECGVEVTFYDTTKE